MFYHLDNQKVRSSEVRYSKVLYCTLLCFVKQIYLILGIENVMYMHKELAATLLFLTVKFYTF